MELRKAIRFVPEKSIYYYNAVVYLNTNNSSLGVESNPPNYSLNCRPEFFYPTESQTEEIDSIINYLETNHHINKENFFEMGGEIVIHVRKLKYKIEIRYEGNCIGLEVLKKLII